MKERMAYFLWAVFVSAFDFFYVPNYTVLGQGYLWWTALALFFAGASVTMVGGRALMAKQALAETNVDGTALTKDAARAVPVVLGLLYVVVLAGLGIGGRIAVWAPLVSVPVAYYLTGWLFQPLRKGISAASQVSDLQASLEAYDPIVMLGLWLGTLLLAMSGTAMLMAEAHARTGG